MRSSKMFKKITSFALVAAMVAPMVVSTPANVNAAKKMKLSKSSFLLATGQKKTVSVKNASKKAKFSWKTSSKRVVAVSGKKAKATLTGKAAGTAKISCVVKNGKKKTTVSGLTVKVRQKVTSAVMQDSKSKACTSIDKLKINEQFTLKAAINNNASGSTTNQTVKWSSSNSKVATVKKSNINSAKVTCKSAGTATITAVVAPNSKIDKKTITCTIKVDDKVAPTPTPTAKPTPTPFPKGVIYKQRSSEVTRWYDPATATQSENGHAHDGYKNNNFAIWMVGFFDNEFSTNEEDINTTYGPDLTNAFNAQYTGTVDPKTGKEKGHDYRGETLNIKGDFSYDGTAQKTILLQINYTKPDDYPIMHKWEKGASTWKGEGPQKNLGLTGACGDEELAPKKTGKVDVTFTIPKDATNGDKDEETGENFGIYIYFPNRPGGALAFRKDNTFHFKNFSITEK